jgi:hypothetical protein
MDDSEAKDSTRNTPNWKVLILVQVTLAIGLLNPWSRLIQIISGIVIAVELFVLVLVVFPIFLYQVFVKNKKPSESFWIAMNSVLPFIFSGI